MINSNNEINIFNNNNNNNIVNIQNTENIPEHERIYDADVYIKDIENYLLNQYPITKQGSKYIQNKIKAELDNILSIKEYGDQIIRYGKNKIKTDILNNEFNYSWIIPIVKDKKDIYIDVLENNNNNNNNNEILLKETLMNKEGLEMKDIRKYLKKINDIEENYNNNKLTLTEYYKLKYKLIQSYKIDYSNTGYKVKSISDTTALRYYDMSTKYWDTHNVNKPIYIYLLEKDENDEYIPVKKKIIEGDEINVVGFMILKIDDFNLEKTLRKLPILNIKTGKTTTIELDNHKLINNENIFITTKNIIGQYKVKVVDNNNIIIKFDSRDLKGESGGFVHIDSKLNYEQTIISKNKKILFDKTVDKNMTKNKVYLFDSFNVTKDDLNEILEKIIPDYNTILSNLYERIKDSIFVDQFNAEVEQYNIDYTNINIAELEYVNGILNENSKKIKEEVYTPSKQESVPDNFQNTIYSYKNIQTPNLVEFYGIYPLLNNSKDTLIKRIAWIYGQPDNGQLFLDELKLETYNISKTEIDKEINKLQIPKTFPLEYKIRILFFSDKNIDDLKDDLNISSYLPSDRIICNNKVYKSIKPGKWELSDDVFNKDDKALYIQYLESKEYQFDGSSWNFIKDLPPHIQSRHMNCFDKEMSLLNNECVSKEFLNYYIKKAIYDTVLSKLDIIIPINKQKYQYTSKISEIENSNNKEDINIDLNESQNLNNYIRQILSLKDQSNRNHLLYKLINLDGIIINDYIYSKRYSSKMMCGHFKFLSEIYNTDIEEEKSRLTTEMMSVYSDAGDVSGELNICKVCGQTLSLIESEDDVVGYTKSASLIHSTTLTHSDLMKVKTEQDKNRHMNQIIDSINPKSELFKNDMLELKLDVDKFKHINQLAILIGTFNKKVGVKIKRSDYYKVIVDCNNSIETIIPYTQFKKKQIMRLKQKRSSNSIIDKYESSGWFKKRFQEIYDRNEYAIIASRLLVSYQKASPPYRMTISNTSCVFEGFQSGIDYMVCIIGELSQKRYKEDLERIRNDFVRYYENYKLRYQSEIDNVSNKKVVEKIVIKPEYKLGKDPSELAKGSYYGNKIKQIITSIIKTKARLGNLDIEDRGYSCCITEPINNYATLFEKGTVEYKKIYDKSLEVKNTETLGSYTRLYMIGNLIKPNNFNIVWDDDDNIKFFTLFQKSKDDSKNYQKLIKNTIKNSSNNLLFTILKKMKVSDLKEVEMNFKKIINNSITRIILFINIYLKKNIFLIRNKIKKEITRLQDVELDVSKVLQEDISTDINYIYKFMENNTVFDKVNFSFSMDYLTDFVNLESVNKETKYELLHELLFTELYRIVSTKDITILKYIYESIKQFNNYYLLILLNDTEMELYNKKRYAERIKERIKYQKDSFISQTFENDPSVLDIEKTDDMDKTLTKQYKEKYMEEHGVAPSDNQIESYKEDYYSEIKTDESIMEDEFLTTQPHETNEILEMGNDYGEMPQGTESSGDGYPDITYDLQE
tara:strand:- start:2359 stop:6834 length:4476 start_codon:yes stop_codon:yes gene_type:complete